MSLCNAWNKHYVIKYSFESFESTVKCYYKKVKHSFYGRHQYFTTEAHKSWTESHLCNSHVQWKFWRVLGLLEHWEHFWCCVFIQENFFSCPQRCQWCVVWKQSSKSSKTICQSEKSQSWTCGARAQWISDMCSSS